MTHTPVDRREALALMAQVPVGRVVVTEGALPAVHPVLFALDGDRVVFRAYTGSVLARAAHDSVVAFQADCIDVTERTGWTTTITGRSTRVADPVEVERLDRLLPLGPNEDEYSWFCITSEFVTGRRTRRSGPE
ncbi:pyridoxamine 5'-phosphate oxidase family protein [Embleya sp. NBC_00896]|uniref:pyridoxamine 5'-phosphate oxidase family protein n=1 Tax=Embleya sp. NBC_00896 TaxID=2975961 RepID=UPI003868E63A|nr:pyridoxamine 5'-phosphate oxidase family protein [Embleya sp. NBC_00896]